MERPGDVSEDARMAKKPSSPAKPSKTAPGFPRQKQRPRNFVKEWRKYRGLTQEALAERAGMTVGNISKLEQFQQGFSDMGLQAIADALDCSPGQLLMVNPQQDGAMWTLWEAASQGDKLKIIDMSRIITGKTGTNG